MTKTGSKVKPRSQSRKVSTRAGIRPPDKKSPEPVPAQADGPRQNSQQSYVPLTLFLGEDLAEIFYEHRFYRLARLGQVERQDPIPPQLSHAYEAARDAARTLLRKIEEAGVGLEGIEFLLSELLQFLADELIVQGKLRSDAPDPAPASVIRMASILLAVGDYAARELNSLPAPWVQPLAGLATTWPCNVRPLDLGRGSKFKEHLRSLKLASKARTGPAKDTFSREVAQHILETLLANREPDEASPVLERIPTERLPHWVVQCRELPPMDAQGAADAWFTVGWQALLHYTDGHPEKHDELSQLGKYRERHSEYTHAQKKVTKATGAANIRDGIHTKLQRAFKRVFRSARTATS